eukprot:jgi/Mesvir1/19074/Mv12830-RA.1
MDASAQKKRGRPRKINISDVDNAPPGKSAAGSAAQSKAVAHDMGGPTKRKPGRPRKNPIKVDGLEMLPAFNKDAPLGGIGDVILGGPSVAARKDLGKAIRPSTVAEKKEAKGSDHGKKRPREEKASSHPPVKDRLVAREEDDDDDAKGMRSTGRSRKKQEPRRAAGAVIAEGEELSKAKKPRQTVNKIMRQTPIVQARGKRSVKTPDKFRDFDVSLKKGAKGGGAAKQQLKYKGVGAPASPPAGSAPAAGSSQPATNGQRGRPAVGGRTSGYAKQSKPTPKRGRPFLWPKIISYVDDAVDAKKLTEEEGRQLRRLARMKNDQLKLVYNGAQPNQDRFVRNVRELLEEHVEALDGQYDDEEEGEGGVARQGGHYAEEEVYNGGQQYDEYGNEVS